MQMTHRLDLTAAGAAPDTPRIGGGALIGGVVLRLMILSLGAAAGFVGAVIGALLLIWLWKTYMR